MYTISIDDPKIYQAGETFAKENHSSLKELVNKYVASLAANVISKKEQSTPFTETEEFKDAMKYMDSFVADDLKCSVPADEETNGAIARAKYEI